MDSFYKEYNEKEKEMIEKNEFNFDHPGNIISRFSFYKFTKKFKKIVKILSAYFKLQLIKYLLT